MSYDPWNAYKNGLSDGYNKMSDGINKYQNGRNGYSISVSTTTTTSYLPVALVVGLVVVGCGVLICLIVLCCVCCRHKTRGRILVAPPATTTQTPAPYLQEQHNPCYNLSPAGGAALYPMATSCQPAGGGLYPYAADPAMTPNKTETVVAVYPQPYESDRLLHVDVSESKPPLY